MLFHGQHPLRVISLLSGLLAVLLAATSKAVGDRAAAIDYGRVLAIHPSFPEDLRREAERLLDQERLFDVLGYLRMLEELVPEDSWVFYTDAVAQAKLGRSAQALEKLERALSLNPGLMNEARLEPAFSALRDQPRIKALLWERVDTKG